MTARSMAKRIAALEPIPKDEGLVDLRVCSTEQLERLVVIRTRMDAGTAIEDLPIEDIRLIASLPLREGANA